MPGNKGQYSTKSHCPNIKQNLDRVAYRPEPPMNNVIDEFICNFEEGYSQMFMSFDGMGEFEDRQMGDGIGTLSEWTRAPLNFN